MEENMHDGKLDDFVRKSLGDYEEDPAPDMWDRVSGALPSDAPKNLLRVSYRPFIWNGIAAAVILMLLSTLVCQHLYYQGQLKSLSGRTMDPPVMSGTKNEKNSDSNQSISGKQDSKSTYPISVNTSTAVDPKIIFKTEGSFIESDPKLALVDTWNQVLIQKPERSSENGGKSNPSKVERTNLQVNSDAERKLGLDTTIALVESVSTLIHAPASDTQFELSAIPKPMLISFLRSSVQALEGPDLYIPAPKIVHIKPAKQALGWYVGLQTSWMKERRKLNAPVSRPGRSAFANTQSKAGSSTILGLKAGKKLNARLALESGIGYQKTVHSGTHMPRFRFGDGVRPEPLSPRRDFTYDLNTMDGTAIVSLRMEQTTPGTAPSDDEQVAFNIKTEHQLEILRIPLLLKYAFGTGRMHWNLKAGVSGNIILKNELNISTRISQNPRLQPVSGTEGYSVQFSQEKFFLGYVLSSGLDIKIGRQTSIFAEPMLLGDFPRKDQYNHKLPSRFLVGLNVGVNYYF